MAAHVATLQRFNAHARSRGVYEKADFVQCAAAYIYNVSKRVHPLVDLSLMNGAVFDQKTE